jgi:hypothetical protein
MLAYPPFLEFANGSSRRLRHRVSSKFAVPLVRVDEGHSLGQPRHQRFCRYL